MKKILIFAGTTEGRKISEALCSMGCEHFISVATEYGEQVLRESEYARVLTGRLDVDEISSLIEEKCIELVVDATHPYATVVTENIKQACSMNSCEYIRILRKESIRHDTYRDVIYFDNKEECVARLISEAERGRIKGNVFLTTGSKDISFFCSNSTLREKIVARILPSIESLKLCEEALLSGKQIVAMQGPFSIDSNVSILKQYGVDVIVTKESGSTGGYYEKLEAARQLGIRAFVIGRPKEDGISSDAFLAELRKEYGVSECDSEVEISLVGCGMGNADTLTIEAKQAIDEAEVLFGASRLVEPYKGIKEVYEYYLAKDIIPLLKNGVYKRVAVLFSGDVSFYSGAKRLNEAIEEAVNSKELNASVRYISGVSSITYLAGKIKEDINDAKIISLHGIKDEALYRTTLINSVRNNQKIFMLTSNADELVRICELLDNNGLTGVMLTVGCSLSTKDEIIKTFKVGEDIIPKLPSKVLMTCYIRNDGYVLRSYGRRFRDSDFIRGNVPMTKEEIRQISVKKLDLNEKSVLVDIGAGTGSVTIEATATSDTIRVYAVEKNKAAVSLIHENINKFGLTNISVIEAIAPEGLDFDRVVDRAFIGGSSGNLYEILDKLYKINPNMKVVINAVTYETLGEITEIEKSFSVREFEIVQVAVTRVNKVGRYHMQSSDNPIWICSFEFM